MSKNGPALKDTSQTADVILIGAGLANGILAIFLRERRPDLRILMIERNSEISAARTWCFHHSDMTPTQSRLLAPLVGSTWNGHAVRFPSYNKPRVMTGHYSAIHPKTLETTLQTLLGKNLRFQSPVVEANATSVLLESGERLTANCVVDGRGCRNDFRPCGYQKFVGLNLKLKEPHGLARPILMDGTVPQLDGYRFMYVLPWKEDELMIEDTRYSDSSEIDVDAYKTEIMAYARARGWRVQSILSEEQGILPIPLNPEVSGTNVDPKKAIEIGMAGGYFHPVTGYSLPDAVRVAEILSSLSTQTTAAYAEALDTYRHRQQPEWKYLCTLNRLLFRAAVPQHRYRVFQRFYTLNESLVQRFYRGQLRFTDKVRILAGSPPVPIIPALRSLRRIDND